MGGPVAASIGTLLGGPVAAGIGAVVGMAAKSQKQVSGAKVIPAIAKFDEDNSGIITVAERQAALAPWVETYAFTEVL